MTAFNRRIFLKLCGAGALSFAGSRLAGASSQQPHPLVVELRDRLVSVVGQREIGLDLRRIDNAGYEQMRLQINSQALYPVASCFKAFLALYYFWYTPESEWDRRAGSPVYDMVVNSENVATSQVLNQVSERIPVYGNAIEKFNDFLLFTLGLHNGLHRWAYDESASVERTDRRFAPSTLRYANVRGARVQLSNLFTAADLADGYTRMIEPDGFPFEPAAAPAIAAALELLAIPAPRSPSPIERVHPEGYIGKDGILPSNNSPAGYVLDDAGIVQIGEGRYVIAFMTAGEGETTALAALRSIFDHVERFDAALRG